MGKTKIEWSEMSWNPITGCTKVSEGCKNCYAERMARRLAGRFGYQEYPYHFDVTYHEDKLKLPYKWKKPRRVFVCSMGDLFHENIDFQYTKKIWKVMAENNQHVFQILTKRPEQMFKFIRWLAGADDISIAEFPQNVWVGVTAENQKTADERIPILFKTPAAVYFVSIEPMLEPISFHWVNWFPIKDYNHLDGLCQLDWLICGGETGPGAREMKAEWAWSLYNQCREANVPFFFKKPGDAFEGGSLPLVREYPRVEK